MSGTVNPDKLLTAAELAPHVGRHAKFIRQMARSGALKPSYVSEGGRKFYTVNEYRRQMQANAEQDAS